MRRYGLRTMLTTALALGGTAMAATPLPLAPAPLAPPLAAVPLVPAPLPAAPTDGGAAVGDPPAGTETLRLAADPTRLTLAITIGDHGPFRFIVDTGAERSVISTALAQSLALAPGATLRIMTMAGREAVPTALIPHLRLSAARSVHDVQAPMLAAADIGADGMLGIDALRAQHVVFDFRHRAMTIAASRAEQGSPDEIVVTAHAQRGRLVLGEARVERLRTDVVLDTGADVTIGNEALRRALAARRRLPPVTVGQITTVTGQTLNVDLIAVRALDVGNLTFRDMPIAFLDSPAFAQLGLADRPALLLGMDALRLFDRVSVDFGSRLVRFRPPVATLPAARVARAESARAPS